MCAMNFCIEKKVKKKLSHTRETICASGVRTVRAGAEANWRTQTRSVVSTISEIAHADIAYTTYIRRHVAIVVCVWNMNAQVASRN